MTDEVLEKTETEAGAGEATDPQVLAQAKLYGYNENYNGANKLSPVEFIRRSFERLDIAKGTIKQIEKTNAELNEKLDRMTKNFSQFAEMAKGAEQRAYAKAKAEIEAKMERAVEDADKEAFKSAKTELEDLNKSISEHPALTGKETEEKPKGPAVLGTPGNPFTENLTEWAQARPWLDNDDVWDYVQSQDRKLGVTNPYQTHKERLDEIEARAKKKFPEVFGLPPSEKKEEKTVKRVAAVEGDAGAEPSNGKGKKSYADLIPEAKKVCDELVADGILKSRDDYVAVADPSLFRS